MWNDDEKLQEELNWKPRGRSSAERARERTPRGVSAIMAMGGALMLPMWGVTMGRMGSVSDLAVIKLLLIFALEGLVAMGIAQFLWRLMGPIPRTLIRPLMILGPLPPLAVICCTGMGIGMSTGVVTEPNPNLASRGGNWGIPRDGESVGFGEAQALCAKLGSEWRMPREDELARVEPTPPLGTTNRTYLANAVYTSYWLLPELGTSPARDVFLRVFCMNKQCRPEVQRAKKGSSGDAGNKAATLCVNF